jgi:hypothetical protein
VHRTITLSAFNLFHASESCGLCTRVLWASSSNNLLATRWPRPTCFHRECHQRTSPAPTCITPSNRPLHCKCGDNGHDLFAESHLPSHCTPSFDLQSCLLPINSDPAIAYFDLPSWRLKQPLHNGEGTDCVAQLASQLPVLAEKLAAIVGWFGHLFSLAAGARREKVTFDSCFWCSALHRNEYRQN